MIKFADETLITVSSGKGGDGCVAFRREKYVPMGGPAGGDGGRGGDVVFVVRRNLRTLAALRYQQSFKAQNGLPGMGKNMHGKDGEDIVIPVPPGTLLKEADSGELIKDFGRLSAPKGAQDGERWVFLKGGKGGWGNTHFKTSVNQAPMVAQPGKPGSSARIRIELQLIADIGLVGFPNAGKSSLLDHFTNARPKIAPYPFTTKIPNLGVLSIHERDIVLADIPGIIEGAHDGAGLGLRFLRHIARTEALAFLVDLSDEKWKTAFPILLDELNSYAPPLAAKRRILLGTKLDLPEAEERLEEFRATFHAEKVFGISVFSGAGIEELREELFRIVEETERADVEREAEAEDFFGWGDDVEEERASAEAEPLSGKEGAGPDSEIRT